MKLKRPTGGKRKEHDEPETVSVESRVPIGLRPGDDRIRAARREQQQLAEKIGVTPYLGVEI